MIRMMLRALARSAAQRADREYADYMAQPAGSAWSIEMASALQRRRRVAINKYAALVG